MLSCKKYKIRLVGFLQWTNGFSRPVIDFTPPSAEDSIYADEIVALGLDKNKRIAKIDFPTITEAAPNAILLHGIGRQIYYWGRDTLKLDIGSPWATAIGG